MSVRGVSSGWRGVGLVVLLLMAAGCEGYRVRPRSRLARHTTEASERAAWCAMAPDACIEACEGGDVRACNMIGVQMELGVGAMSDPRQAAIVYTHGCDADYAPACTNLGWLVLRGRGVPANPPLALVLFQRAYDGYARACSAGSGASCMSALDTMDLLAPTQDEERVTVALLERGCALGESRACAELGR